MLNGEISHRYTVLRVMIPERKSAAYTSWVTPPMFRRIPSHRSPPVRSLLTRHTVKCFSSEKATERTEKDRWEHDPRPPWVYSTSAALRLVLIPSAYSFYWEIRHMSSSIRKVLYFMLYFLRISVIGSTSSCRYVVAAALLLRKANLISIVKPRRWLRRQQDAFFTITPEERKLVEGATDNRVHRETSAGHVAVPSDS